MKDTNFIVIQGWMINNLKLKGNNLLVFAIVYGFSQDQETKFKGSLDYIQKSINASKNTVLKAINFLEGKNLIYKGKLMENNVERNQYWHNEMMVQKLNRSEIGGSEIEQPTGSKSEPRGGAKSEHNNITNNNILDNKDLFGEIVIDPKKKTLFKNCVYSDFSKFKLKLKEVEELGIDVGYYHRAIDRWSRSSSTKRTADGWLATAENWMEKDKEKGQLRMVKSEDQLVKQDDEALEYLKTS